MCYFFFYRRRRSTLERDGYYNFDDDFDYFEENVSSGRRRISNEHSLSQADVYASSSFDPDSSRKGSATNLAAGNIRSLTGAIPLDIKLSLGFTPLCV